LPVHTITFNQNYTGSPAPTTAVTGTDGRLANLPAAPTRTGFTFVGWFDTQGATGGTQLTTAIVHSTNTTYFARWTALPVHTITFNQNYTTAPTPTTAVTGTDGRLAALPAAPTRTGFTFVGWFTTADATGGTQLTTAIVHSTNTTYFARWTAVALPSISLSPTNITFAEVTVGYARPDAQQVTITNNGTVNTQQVNMNLSGTGASAFELTTPGFGSGVEPGTPRSFPVRPVEGLGAGTYTATVTVSGAGIAASQTMTVSITVSAPVVRPTRAIFDMETHAHLEGLAVSGGGALLRVPNLPFVGRMTGSGDPNPRVVTVKMTAPREINITGRGGSLQGVAFRLNDIPTRANHEYIFEVAGTLGTAAGATAIIRNGTTSASASLHTNTTVAGGAFNMTVANNTALTRSREQIAADITTQGADAFYAIGNSGGSNSDMKITQMRILEACLPSCTTCVAYTITFNLNYPSSPANFTRMTELNRQLLTMPTNPTRPNFNFVGWFDTAAAEGGNNITTNTVFNGNTMVYARWADPSAFRTMTAHQVVDAMGLGWNLGNNFDAWASEASHGGSYSNPLGNHTFPWTATNGLSQIEGFWGGGSNFIAKEQLIANVKAQGFNTIRIPVTWHKAIQGYTHGTQSTYSTFTIRSAWMDRVKEVVDWAIKADMYVILNTHHDEFILPFRTDAEANSSSVTITRLWTLIAREFRDYDHRLIFEVQNEPRIKGSSHEWQAGGPRGNAEARAFRRRVNEVNQAAVNAIRAQGTSGDGNNNRWRVLMIPTYAASRHVQSWGDAFDGYVRPTDISLNSGVNKFAVSVHAYVPEDYTGVTGTGGSWTESSATSWMSAVQTAAQSLGMPVVLGEFGAVARHASSTNSAETDRANWTRVYVREAVRRGWCPVWWDTGTRGPVLATEGRFGLFNRQTNALEYPNITAAIREGNTAGRALR